MEHPEREGRLRSISSSVSNLSTSPFTIDYAYADECSNADPSTCPPPGPPAQLKTISRNGVTTTLTWDGSLLTSEALGATASLGAVTRSLTYNTDFAPTRETVTVGASSFPQHLGYDGDGVLTCAAVGTSCAPPSVGYVFDDGPGDAAPSGHGLLEATTSGVVTETFTYNTHGELATHTATVGGVPTRATTYHATGAERDAVGRIVTKTVTTPGGTKSVTYGYDALGQIETVTPSDAPERHYKYDGNGNRLCKFEAPDTDCVEEAVYDVQDRLMVSEGVNYAYTDRGTLLQKDDGTKLETFTYDALGNLTRVQSSEGLDVRYVMDAFGRRVLRNRNGVRTQYVWSGGLRIVAELDGAGVVKQRFVYGNGVNVPALVVRPDPAGDKVYRVITDHLGSPVYIVNVADPGDVLLDAEYDEWGNVVEFTSSTGAWPVPFGFAGGLYDEETGFVRFSARDYDARLGRWTSKDPAIFAGGQTNLYAYVSNNPVNGTDPSGLYADVQVLGDDVRIRIPIDIGGPGANRAHIQNIKNAIEQQWTGQFGRYNVVTTVEFAEGAPNHVDVLLGMGRPGVWWGSVGEFYEGGQEGGDPAWEFAHEAGHLIGLGDMYDPYGDYSELSVMNEYGLPVTEFDIRNAIHVSGNDAQCF